MTTRPTSPYDIARNDIAAALRVLREHAAVGPVAPTVLRTLAMLQDQPKRFLDAAKSVPHTVAD